MQAVKCIFQLFFYVKPFHYLRQWDSETVQMAVLNNSANNWANNSALIAVRTYPTIKEEINTSRNSVTGSQDPDNWK